MSHNHIKQKNSLSQVFLKDSWPCQFIADFIREKDIDAILEIGPGGGILTQELIALNKPVIAVEKDPRFVQFLQSKYADVDHLKIVSSDIRSIKLNELFPGQKIAVCGNVPYHISTAIIEWMFHNFTQVAFGCFMFQKEFAARVCAESGTKAYGSLSVFCQLQSNMTYEVTVPKEIFKPVPKVDSAIISIFPKKSQLDEIDASQMEKMVKLIFSQRRKKLHNILQNLFKDVEWKDCHLDLSRRPEDLSPDEFVRLYCFARESNNIIFRN